MYMYYVRKIYLYIIPHKHTQTHTCRPVCDRIRVWCYIICIDMYNNNRSADSHNNNNNNNIYNDNNILCVACLNVSSVAWIYTP